MQLSFSISKQHKTSTALLVSQLLQMLSALGGRAPGICGGLTWRRRTRVIPKRVREHQTVRNDSSLWYWPAAFSSQACSKAWCRVSRPEARRSTWATCPSTALACPGCRRPQHGSDNQGRQLKTRSSAFWAKPPTSS